MKFFAKPRNLKSCQVTPPQVAALAQAIDPSMFTCRVGEMVETVGERLIMSTVPANASVDLVTPRRGVDPRVKILYLAWVFVMVSVLAHPLILSLIFPSDSCHCFRQPAFSFRFA